MFSIILTPFTDKNGILKKIKGSAMQMAIMSSVVLGAGGYYMSSSTNSVVEASRSFMSANMKQTIGFKLYNASKSNNAILLSAEKSGNSKALSCLNDPNTCKDTSSIDLYSTTGKKLTGKYNRFGHNCDVESNNFCDSRDIVLEVSKLKIAPGETGPANMSKTLKLSYNSKIPGKPGDIEGNYLSDSFDFTGLGSKTCPKDGSQPSYISGITGGEVSCGRPMAFVGAKGDTGDRGNRGGPGLAGNRGPNGPAGPRGPRGSLYYTRTGGCFAPDTQILVANGSYKKISEINEGELLLNPITGETVKAMHVVKGPERLPMVYLQAGDFDIEVTLKHPMIVKDLLSGEQKVVAASSIKKGDMIQTTRGFIFVDKIEKRIKDQDYQVYNIQVEHGSDLSDYMIQAEGFVTADLYIQKLLDKSKSGEIANFDYPHKSVAH